MMPAAIPIGKRLYFLSLAILAVQAISFAWLTPPGVPPDELWHLQLIDLYRTSSAPFPFSDSWLSYFPPLPEFSRFGRGAELPYLYHLTIGEILRLTSLSTYTFPVIFFLRLLNFCFAALVLQQLWKTQKLCAMSAPAGTLALLLPVSFPIFALLSASVSYDMPANAAAAIAFYQCCYYLRSGHGNHLLNMLLALLVGTLIKISLLPLVFLFLIAVGIFERLSIKEYWRNLGSAWLRAPRRFRASLLILALLNTEFYLGNIAQYGKPLPRCEQIFSEALCQNNYYFARNQKIRALGSESDQRMDILTYSYRTLRSMVDQMFGMKAQVSYVAGKRSSVSFFALAIIATILVFWRRATNPQWLQLSLFIAFSYLFIVVVFWNYGTYLRVGGPSGLGVNGRYAFPVLIPLVLIFSQGILSLFRGRRASIATAAILCLVFGNTVLSWQWRHTKENYYRTKPTFYETLQFPPNPAYDEHFRIRWCPAEPRARGTCEEEIRSLPTQVE